MGDNNIEAASAAAGASAAVGRFQLSLKAMSNMLPSAKTPQIRSLQGPPSSML